jgi:predicted small lipoprotein YifL
LRLTDELLRKALMIRLRIFAVAIAAGLTAALAGCGERPPLALASATIEGPYRLDAATGCASSSSSRRA